MIRTQEDTLAKERWARRAAWDLAKFCSKIRGNLDQIRATFFSPSKVWCVPTPSTVKVKEREFVVDSWASMYMLRKKDLNSAELETVRVSRTPHKSRYDKWRSANKRGSNNARRRFGFIRGGTASGRHADSSVAWTTLRRSWVLPCVDCRSKNHTFSKMAERYMQHRTSCR